MSISYIQRADIEEEKWNACIRDAGNSFPYAYSWYLDSVAPHWDALISHDYRAVFPLVWKQRLGIKYLYQPMFTQQLGVFSIDDIDESTVNLFLSGIPKKFQFIEINVNYQNPWVKKDFLPQPRLNLLLDLNISYEKLFQSYHDNVKRNLQKAKKKDLRISEAVSAETVIEFFKTNTGVRIPELGEYHYEHLSQLIDECMKTLSKIWWTK